MRKTHRRVRLGAALFCVAAGAAHAQISLTTAVDLALRSSPRVKMSEADVAKARAVLSEAKDILIPSVTAGANLGQAYGYSSYPPTLFSLTSQSLIYNSSQFSYIHSARAGIDAAQHALEDARESVAEDVALTFVALEHDQQRRRALREEAEFAARLLAIVQDRLDAGQDTRMDLNEAELSAKRLHLAAVRTEIDTENDRSHLARLTGVPADALTVDGGFPVAAITAESSTTTGGYANPAVAAAFETAKAKQLQAHGDRHFLYRPQLSFFAQYQRYATFTNAFHNLQEQYYNKDTGTSALSSDEEAFGVQISIPLYDRLRTSKAVESAAEAARSLHDAEFAQMNALDAQGRLNRNMELLQAQSDVAALELERAQLQLADVQFRLASASVGPPMTPKDEQNARIAEREKYLAVIDNAFQLRQAKISFLRQTGHLVYWLQHTSLSGTPSTPSISPPHP